MVAFLAKSVVIAFIAACAGIAPLVLLMAIDASDVNGLIAIARGFLLVAILGSFTIGLPVAWLTWYFSSRHIQASAQTLFMIANLAGVMMFLASFSLAGVWGLIFLGLPSFVAANAFAVLGWYWIVKPAKALRNV